MNNFCGYCGEKIDGDPSYCPCCGKKLTEDRKKIVINRGKAENNYHSQKIANKRQAKRIIIGIIGGGIVALALVFCIMQLGNGELLNLNSEIDLDTYGKSDAQKLLEDFPYNLKEGVVFESSVWKTELLERGRNYSNSNGEIVVNLNDEKTKINALMLSGSYKKVEVAGLHTGMTLEEAKKYALENKFFILKENDNEIVVETPASTNLIYIKKDSENECCKIMIEFDEVMDVSEKENKKQQYIKAVKNAMNISSKLSNEEILKKIDGDSGDWDCSLTMEKLLSDSGFVYIYYKTDEMSICWTIRKSLVNVNKSVVNLAYAIIENQKMENQEDIIQELLKKAGVIEELIIGIWHNGGTQWADNYHTIFYENGTVEHIGYRNEDTGYYVCLDNNTIEATFDGYIDWAGGYKEYLGWYKVYYTYNSNTGTLDRRMGQWVYDSTYNNDFDNRELVKVDKMVEDRYD